MYLQLLFWKCGKDFLQQANSMQCGGGCPTLNLLDQIFSYMWCSWMMFWGTLTHQKSAALQNCIHSMLRCLAHLKQTIISDNVNKSTDWSKCQTNRKAQHNPTNSTMPSPLHINVYPPSSAFIICVIKFPVQICGRLSHFQYPRFLQIQNILIALTSLV